MYITTAVTVSDNPHTSLSVTIILVGGLLLLKGSMGVRVYKNSLVDIVDTITYFNLLVLAAFSWHDFKTDVTKWTAFAYVSTIITFILLVGIIIYHVILLFYINKTSEEVNEYPLLPIQLANSEVTHSIIEIFKPQYPQPEPSSDENIQESNDSQTVRSPYILAT